MKRIDKDHKGLNLMGRFMIIEAIVVIILAVGAYLYKRYG